MFSRDLRDGTFAGVHVVGFARDLDQEHRAGVERETRMIVRFDGLGDGAIHDLERGRDDARADDRRDRRRSTLDVTERRDADANRGRDSQQFQIDRGDDAKCPFAADERAREIIARIVLRGVVYLAILCDELKADDVIGHRTIRQGVRTAGVGTDVAAERRDFLRRGIGAEEKAMRLRLLRKFEVDHAGLDARAPIAGVE